MPVSPVLSSGSVFLTLKQCPIRQVNVSPLFSLNPPLRYGIHVLSHVFLTPRVGGHHVPILQVRKLRL